MVDLETLASRLDAMYTDRMDVARAVKQVNEDGSTRLELRPVPALQDVPCRISFEQPDRHDTAMDQNDPRVNMKVFAANRYRLQKGDRLVLRRIIGGQAVQVYQGYAAQPVVYDIGQEILLTESGGKYAG